MDIEKGPFPFTAEVYDWYEQPPYAEVWGWNGEDEAFEHILTKYQPNIIIEVGTWLGQSAIHMAKLRPEAIIYCVDTWLGSPEMYMRWHPGFEQCQAELNRTSGYPTLYYRFLNNVVHNGCRGRIIPVPQTSHGAAMLFDHYEIKADAIYIDAGHDTESVAQDIHIWRKNVRPGGIIFGDDYDWPSVKTAVDQYCAMHDYLKLSIDGIKWIIENV